MEEITLKKKQEINGISLRSSDNGGVIINFTIYTQTPSKNQSGWDEHTETYEADEFESKVLPRITELYKKDYEHRIKGKSPSKGGK